MTANSLLAGVAAMALALAASGQVPQEPQFTKDVVYGHADGVDLKLDLAVPASGDGPFPALVFIHGGGWQMGAKSDYEAVIRQFATLGYVTASVGYRFAPAHPWPAQIHDVKCAVRYLRANAAQYRIDPDKIGAAGHSAGGHLSLLLGLTDDKDGLEGDGGHPGFSSKVQVVLNLCGPTDLRVWRALPEAQEAARAATGQDFEDVLKDFVGTTDRTAAVIAQASPITYIDAGDAAVITFHGSADPVVPVDQASLLHKALDKAGVMNKLVVIEGGNHGFEDPLHLIRALVEGQQFADSVLKGSQPAESGAVSDAEPPAFEDILKIDAHSHLFDDVPEFVDMLRRTNMKLINICLYGNRPELLGPAHWVAEHFSQKYSGAIYHVSTFDLTKRDEADYAQQVIAWIDGTIERGALMVKIWKEVGMELKKPDGSFLMPDDPVFDPIYAHLAKRGIPLLAHFADPIEAWLPLDPSSPHHAYYSNNAEWHLYGREGYPTHAELIEARDNIMVKHPDLILVGAHLGSMAHDVDEVAKRFDRFPNFYADVSARTPILRRQPVEKVRDFFVKYQDRLLYGVDFGRYTEGRTPTEEERQAFADSMEKGYRADYAYYSGREAGDGGAGKSLGLPREALEKFYHENAERLMPRLKE